MSKEINPERKHSGTIEQIVYADQYHINLQRNKMKRR